ncbi:putative 2'-phosphotransferase [Rosa chinensis]|uniref:2'-phosphotransferase n=1 Tax=Rosa chinensis TaxID=74649 RepID=A0A2P6P7D9_ROSCH|nr:putative 2'-phosphotransferase [Rosa chinensis]
MWSWKKPWEYRNIHLEMCYIVDAYIMCIGRVMHLTGIGFFYIFYTILCICRTRILRHMASDLNLDMRSDGFVKVHDLLELNLKAFANIPLSSHIVDEIKEAVRKDNKQRFSLLEENEELLMRANQGRSTTATILVYLA